MRTLWLVFAFALAANAQYPLTNMKIEFGYGAFRLEGVQASPTPGYIWIEYGTTTSLGSNGVGSYGYQYSGEIGYPAIGGLAPSTTYYFRPGRVPDGGSVDSSWDCRTATGGITASTYSPAQSGFGCDAGTGLGWFTTLPLPVNYNTDAEFAAADVSSVRTGPPTPTLSPLTVTANDSADLVSKLDTCAANTAAGGVQEVILPAGSDYTISYDAAAKAGGNCYVHTSALSNLPPSGVRIEGTTWDQYMVQIHPYIADMSNQSMPGGSAFSGAIRSTDYNSTSNGWYFRGIIFSTEPYMDRTYTPYNITNVSDDGNTITLDAAGPAPSLSGGFRWSAGEYLLIDGVVGTWGTSPNGPRMVTSWTTGSKTVVLRDAIHTISCSSSPCYTSGGRVRIAKAVRVCGATNANPIVVTTCEEHHLSERKKVAVSAISGSVITIPAGNDMVFTDGSSFWVGDSYEVELSGGPANGIYRIAANGNGTTLSLTGLSVTCASSCGTAQLLNPVAIQGVLGNTAANGSPYYRVTSSTTLTLINKTGNGAYTSGGIVAQETPKMTYLMGPFNGASDIVFDQVIFRGGFPYRYQAILGWNCTNCAVRNSHFQDIQSHGLIRGHATAGATARTRLLIDANSPWDAMTPQAFEIGTTNHNDIYNNLIECHGNTIFMPDPPDSTSSTQNVRLAQNILITTDDKIAGTAASNGLYFPHRHHLEWKRGTAITVEGNQFVGGWVDYNQRGPSIMITPRSYHNGITDIIFRNNIISDFVTGFYLVSTDLAGTQNQLQRITRNVDISNNLFLRNRVKVAIPNDKAITDPNYDNGATPIYYSHGAEGWRLNHNTYTMPLSATETGPFTPLASKAAGFRWTNSIMYWVGRGSNEYGPIFTPDVGYYFLGYSESHNNIGNPHVTGTIKNAFDTVMGPSSSWGYNVVIPGPKTFTAGLDRTTLSGSSNTFTARDCFDATTAFTGAAYFSGFTSVACPGSRTGGSGAGTAENETTKEREALVKWVSPTTGDYGLRSDSPYAGGAVTSDKKDAGVDMGKIRTATGAVSTVSVVAGAATATFSYSSPQSCTVEVGTGTSPGAGSRVTDSAGTNPGARTASFTGLTTGTNYRYWVLCPSQIPTGQFRTL